MSFEIALTGINAINTDLETISNNIANSSTYGFKSSRANFASMYAGTQPTGTEVSSLTQSIGVGGSVLTTGRGMDVAIKGAGFFTTRTTSGETQYSRVGVFSTDKDGYVVDSFNRRVQGYVAIPGTTTLGGMGDLLVTKGQLAAQASDTLNYVGNLSADWSVPAVAPFSPTDPQTFNGSMASVVYDSLGAQHTVTQYFVHTGNGTVDVHYTFDGTQQAATNTLTFGPDGKLTGGTQASLALAPANGANAITLAVNYTGTTQYAGQATTTVNSSNGYASGSYNGVAIDKDGSVMALYSNGQKQSVGKVAIATFPNEDGLVPVSDTSWTTSNASGNPLYDVPGNGMAGTLTPGALEQSNVDLTGQLVGLMTAQRNYQANTKVFSTQNAMMQSLMQAV